MTHIAIIGAGVTGITTAYALRKRGFEVTVVERHRYAAMETSFANGGQLSVSNAEVWNHASTVLKGFRWLFRRDAPLLLNLSPSWHKYSWLTEFVMNIGRYQDNTIATTRLALDARSHLFAIAEQEGIDFDLERRGILHIYKDRPDFEHATHVNALLAEGGLDRRPVTPEEIHTIEPVLAGSYYGGFFTPSDGTGDIHKFTRGLADVCEKNGVKLLFDVDVESVDRSGRQLVLRVRDSLDAETLSADAIVVCAGCESRRLAALVGDRLNIYPVKGYSVTVPLQDGASRSGAPWVSLLDDKAKIVTSRLGVDRFRIAGTAEFSGFNRDIRADRIKPLVDWVRDHFPHVSTSAAIPWSGLRPMMPNMLPKVGSGHDSRVFYNTGHGHLGWTLSAGTAEAIATLITGRFETARRLISV